MGRIRWLLAALMVYACGALTSAAQAAPPSTALGFGYDDLGRLVLASDPTSFSGTYHWDPVGNMLSISRAASSVVAVTQVTPLTSPPGTQVTIYGSGFSTTTGQDTVTFNGTAATVVSATANELLTTVPAAATSGSVAVTAPGGSATSPASFTVSSARAPTISSLSASVATAGSPLTVSGTHFATDPNQTTLGVNRTRMAITSATATTLTTTVPSNAASGQVKVWTANGTAATGYLWIPPAGITASQVEQHAAVSYGHATPVSISSSTGAAMFAISVSPNQRMSVALTGSDFGGGYATMTIYDPYNQSIASINDSSHLFIDPVTVTTGGTYTVVVRPGFLSNSVTGSLTVYSVPADTLTTVTPSTTGATASIATTVPGQNANVTFSGTSGERLSFDSSSWSEAGGSYCGLTLRVTSPDTTGLVTQATMSPPCNNTYVDTVTLPQTGTYTMTVDPQRDGVVTGNLTVYQVPPDPTYSVTPTAAGSSASVATTTPGQNAHVTFNGTPGERVAIDTSNWSVAGGSYCGLTLNLNNPDGSGLASQPNMSPPCNNRYLDRVTLPQSGTYTAIVDPQGDGTVSGTVTIYQIPADTTSSVVPAAAGASVNVATTTPGQNATVTFSATAGQRISVDTSNWSVTNGTYCGVTFYLNNPDGSNLVNQPTLSSPCNNSYVDIVTLGQTGTYTIAIDPQGNGTASGSLKVYLVPGDSTGALSIGGAAGTVTIGTPGQNGTRTFTGATSQAVTLTVSADTVSSAQISVYKPDGSALTSGNTVGTAGASLQMTLGPAGTYTILVKHQGNATGSMQLALTQTPGGARIAPNGSSGARVPGHGPTIRLSWVLRHEGAGGSREPAAKRPGRPKASGRPGRRQAVQRRRQLAHQRANQLNRVVPRYHAGPAAWSPGPNNLSGAWITRRQPSPWARLAPLYASDGLTALSGQALQLNGMPLGGVTVSLDGTHLSARTDVSGRFLLGRASAGHHVLSVDGGTARAHGATFASFELGVDLARGRTTVLGSTVWLPELDAAHSVAVQSPTRAAISLATPHIPGLQVRIPAGSRITAANGKPVKRLSVVAVPVDRPPFGLPLGSYFPVYLSVQPAGAYVSGGAEIIYPNYSHLPPGQRVPFWNYDPAGRGWYIYGKGTVSRDDKHIVPDPGVRVWRLSGAMISGSFVPPWLRCLLICAFQGDPVDQTSGMFEMQKTDLQVPGPIPVAATRVYRPADSNSYSFGIGMTSAYDMRLFSTNNYQTAELILPDGMDIHYARTSSGFSYQDAVYKATTTPTQFYGSTLAYDGAGWTVKLRSGVRYLFALDAAYGLAAIVDRLGNEVFISRNSSGGLQQVTGPNGRWIKFTLDQYNRVVGAADSAGRAVTYAYNAAGQLASVQDVNGRTSYYTYDPSSGWMTQIQDARGITWLTNQYDANGRVRQQTTSSGTTTFSYQLDSGTGLVTQTTMTDPDGHVRVTNVGPAGTPTSVTVGSGTPQAQTTQFVRQPGTGFLTSETDQLGRTTTFGYDALGNPASITQMAGTGSARTTAYTYNASFSELTSLTDPLWHRRAWQYNAVGECISTTDPLSQTTWYSYDPYGSVTSATDPAGDVTTYGYAMGDASSVTDPNGNVSSQFVDAAGRVAQSTDANGDNTLYAYDALSELKTITDPTGKITSFTYDPNGNRLSIKDANTHRPTFTYDSADRLRTRIDALNHTWTYGYDGNNNLTSISDPNTQATTYQYDALDRLTIATYSDAGGHQSVTNYTYDGGSRLTQASDVAGGTFNEQYDNFNALTQESGPNGQVNYTYDGAGRRATAAVQGQATYTYGYDNANQLTSISGGGRGIGMSYDSANRVQQLALSDGITQNYSYDPGSNPTDILYKNGVGTQIGDLHYAYSPSNQRTAEWGSYARLTVPQAYGPATYNADNQITSDGTHAYAFDANGNLTSDGANTYGWDARDRLTSISGAHTASFGYDAFGRREQAAIAGTATAYVNDGANVAQELTGGTSSATYILGLGLDDRYARITSGGASSYLTDALGSTIGLADSTGAVPTTYSYQPFGAATASGTASTNPYQYAGQANDGTGLNYDRARYYNSATGAFASQDPAGYAGSGVNLYQYANNTPTNLTDPTGRSSVLDALGLGCVGNLLAGRKDVAGAVGCIASVGIWFLPGGGQLEEGALALRGAVGGVEDGARSLVGDAAAACDANSFTGDTPVKLVNGKEKPIAKVKLGDYVVATDPTTGKTGPRKVTGLINDSGVKQMVAITLADGEVLQATTHHPFWDVTTHSFTYATDLHVGDQLERAHGGSIQVTIVRRYTAYEHVYNLTVSGVHTFYVGTEPVLVHNSCLNGEVRGKLYETAGDVLESHGMHGAGTAGKVFSAGARSGSTTPELVAGVRLVAIETVNGWIGAPDISGRVIDRVVQVFGNAP
jgi:RHS repeat-associated protein